MFEWYLASKAELSIQRLKRTDIENETTYCGRSYVIKRKGYVNNVWHKTMTVLSEMQLTEGYAVTRALISLWNDDLTNWPNLLSAMLWFKSSCGAD